MFYLVKNLKTALLFPPNDMHKLAREDQIIKRLKDKVENICHSQYGYIIQQINYGAYGKNQNGEGIHYKITVPQVVENGCKVIVTFTAVCFKAQKNDIIDFRVTQILDEKIKGTIGPAQVLIPRSKMDPQCEYKKDENIYIVRMGTDLKIDKGTKIRCKCFEIIFELGQQMKIIASLPGNLLKFIEN